MIFYNSTNISQKTQALSPNLLTICAITKVSTMIHIDLSSKRARLALRFFSYGVMTLATIFLTIAAVFYAMGYRFNQNDLTFEQGGLIQFRSLPGNAQVVIDDKLQNFTTPGRANLGAGTHTIKMQLSGYRTWQKTVTLGAGQLLWLDYTRLLPETITTREAATFSAATDALASPDHKWMLVHNKADQPNFQLVDMNDPKKPLLSDLTVPESQLTKDGDNYGAFKIVEWDLSSRYILLEHTVKDTHEYLRLDRQHAAEAKNISRLFSLNITEAHFAGSNSNILYAKTDNVLRSVDIGANSASAVLIAGVEQFMVYGNDTVAFVATRNATEGDDATKQRIAGIYVNGKETIARTYPASATVHVAYSEYTRHAYLAITAGDSKMTILRDPTVTTKDNLQVAAIDLGKPVAWLKFSSNGRMLVLGNGSTVATYDLELDKTTSFTVSGAELTAPLQWLDDYYLWTDAGGGLRIFEYDNTNGREITTVELGLTAGLSQDGAYLYSFAKNGAGQFGLQSSQLSKN